MTPDQAPPIVNPPPPPAILADAIGHQVLVALGDPGGRRRVQVRPLWDSYYRVNVLLEDKGGAVSIVHSYFLQADGRGAIVTATPAIIRRY